MVSRDFSLRPTVPTPQPTNARPRPAEVPPAEASPEANAPAAEATEALDPNDQSTARTALTAENAALQEPQVDADLASLEARLPEVSADAESYARFAAGETAAPAPVDRAAVAAQLDAADALVTQSAEELLALTSDQTHAEGSARRRERQDIPAARTEIRGRLQQERESLATLRAGLDPVQDEALIADLDTRVGRLTAAESLVDQAGALDEARRGLLDANFGVDSRGRVTLSEEQLRTEIGQRVQNLESAAAGYEEALAELAGPQNGAGVLDETQVESFRALSTRTRQDLRQFNDFIYNPDNTTMDMMEQLGRGGRSLRSRYQNYSGFMNKRLEGNRSGRSGETYERFNTQGYVNSLRHDLSDARVFSQRFSRVLQTMEQRAGTSNPMSAEELRSEVRGIYSTESGDPFVRQAVIQATTDVGEARRLTQVAQRQIDQASRLLDQADSRLGEAATAQDASHFDEARLRVTQAREDIEASRATNTQAQGNLAEARVRNSGDLSVLPPSMQRDLSQTQGTTSGRITDLEGRAADNTRRADELSAAADTRETDIQVAEEAAIRERERNGEQINYFLGALETMAPGSQANIQLELGVRLGTSAGSRVGASVTGRAVVGLTAEKGAGLGGTYTVRANFGFEGEARAQFFGLSGSIEYSRMFSNGVSFYRAEQAQEFARLTTQLTESIGDNGFRSSETTAAWNALVSYADQNAYSADTEAVTATGTFGDQEIQFQGSRGTHNYTTFDDRAAPGERSNGVRDAGEAQIQERIREEGLSGSFTTRIRGQQVGVTVSTTSATLEERRVDGAVDRRASGNETSNVTKVRLTLPYSALETADDRTLEQMLVSALATVPGSDPQMRIDADTFRGQWGQVRTQARSQRSSTASVVIEYARLRNPDGSVENALRVGRHQERKGEMALPTVNPAIQVVGGYEQSSTVLTNVVTW